MTVWLGRVTDPDTHKTRTVRALTDGDQSPKVDRMLEAIEDPFVDWEAGDLAKPCANLFARVGEAPTTGWSVKYGQASWLPPVRSYKIIGFGRNYSAHAAELGNDVPQTPLLFLKPASCLVGCDQNVTLLRGYERIDMESELVVVIGAYAKQISVQDAWNYVGGYTLGNDVSCRDLQKQDNQWTRAKGSDGFGPLGPMIRVTEPGYELPVSSLHVCGYHNDEPVQKGCVGDMTFSIPKLIAHITQSHTLEPGDLIYTGTPAGVHPLVPGDQVRVELEGMDLGQLTNRFE